jgi:Protein of unknown function (DUF2283)
MKTIYYPQDDILEIRLRDKPVAREVSLDWNVNVSYAEDGTVMVSDSSPANSFEPHSSVIVPERSPRPSPPLRGERENIAPQAARRSSDGLIRHSAGMPSPWCRRQIILSVSGRLWLRTS